MATFSSSCCLDWTNFTLPLLPPQRDDQNLYRQTSGATATAHRSTQPPADITIERALELVATEGYAIAPGVRPKAIANSPDSDIPADDWSFIDEDVWNTSLAPGSIKERAISYTPNFQPTPTIPRKLIRGLGSLLANRNLVLITTENEILDVLTRQQQQKLQIRVSRELATKLLQGDNLPTPILLPSNSNSSPAIDTPAPQNIRQPITAHPPAPKIPSWWHKLIDRPVSPNLGFVPTAPKIAPTEAISVSPPQPEIIRSSTQCLPSRSTSTPFQTSISPKLPIASTHPPPCSIGSKNYGNTIENLSKSISPMRR